MAQKSVVYNKKEFLINYDIANAKEQKSIAVLHGWGSNKEIMKSAFEECLNEFKHIYIDMPGFGKSPNEDQVLTTQDYANIIKLFLGDEDLICAVGHSFGGKVATLLNPKNLVLLSSSGILEPKPLKVKIKIAIFKLFKSFGGVKLRSFFASDDAKQMNQAMYETFKNVVNEDFSASFAKCTSNAIVIWGKSDTATKLSSGQTIAKLISNSKFFPLDGDHYFFLKQKKVVCDIIRENLKKGD